MFEPRSLTVSDDVSVAVAAESLGSTLYYIGINDRISDNVLAYDSDDTSVSISIPWHSGQPSYSVPNGDCGTIRASSKTWVMIPCTTIDMAICEKP